MKCARKVRKESDVLKEFITTTEKLVVQQARPDSRLPPEQLMPLLEVATLVSHRLWVQLSFVAVRCTGRMCYNVCVCVHINIVLMSSEAAG